MIGTKIRTWSFGPLQVLLSVTLVALGCNANLSVQTTSVDCSTASSADACSSLTIVTTSTIANTSSLPISWQADGIDADAGVQLRVSSSADCASPEAQWENLQGTSFELKDLADGQYYVCLYGKPHPRDSRTKSSHSQTRSTANAGSSAGVGC